MIALIYNLMTLTIDVRRFGGLEEKKEKKAKRGGEKKEKETDDDNDETGCSMMLEDDLVLGPETAFLAEGSVHDTGGMVEWAGTVGPFSISLLHLGFSSILLNF